MPLAIDPVYGSGRGIFLSDFKADYRLGKEKTEQPLIERLTLHAYQLEISAEQKCFVAKLDKKFAATIKMLAKYNADASEVILNDEYLKILNGQKI